MEYINEILVDGQWQVASSHTQSIDCNIQFQRFLSSGVPADQLRQGSR